MSSMTVHEEFVAGTRKIIVDGVIKVKSPIFMGKKLLFYELVPILQNPSNISPIKLTLMDVSNGIQFEVSIAFSSSGNELTIKDKHEVNTTALMTCIHY